MANWATSAIESGRKAGMLRPMPMTLDQVVTETRQWPPGQVAEQVDRLTTELHPDAEDEAAWRAETRRRVAEIESGRVEGVPGEAVSARVRQIVGR